MTENPHNALWYPVNPEQLALEEKQIIETMK